MMEEFYTNFNNTNNFTNSSDNSSSSNSSTSLLVQVVEWTVLSIGLPLILLAIAAVYFLVRKDHVAPIYVINLLISDLLQLCSLTLWKAGVTNIAVNDIHTFGLMASVGFMVCISMERYLVIAWPMWYRFKRSIKTSVVFCVIVWILPLVYVLPAYVVNHDQCSPVFGVFCLLPLPLFIFFLVGTIRALSTSRSVPADEKRRIAATLVALLLIYALLFLPIIVLSLVKEYTDNVFYDAAFILVYLSPLADLTLYFFIRRGAIDNLLKSICCCKNTYNQQTNSSLNYNMPASCTDEV